MTPQNEGDRLAPVTPLFGRRQDARGSNAELGEWASSEEIGSDESSAPTDGSGAAVTELPTYAAFAAKSEEASVGHPAIRGPKRPVPVAATDEAEAEAEADPEAESTDAARARAENISMHALSRRGVSSHEMKKTLQSRDLPEEVVVDEIARLEGVGLLNDTELAEILVRSKQERKGLGRSAISSDLRQRGIAPEAIEAALADIDDDEEQTRADEWASKRARQLSGLDQATAERRLTSFLLRRGYRSEAIRRAVEKALPRGRRAGGPRFE